MYRDVITMHELCENPHAAKGVTYLFLEYNTQCKHICGCLNGAGIFLIAELAQKTRRQLGQIANLSSRNIQTIHERMNAIGLPLGTLVKDRPIDEIEFRRAVVASTKPVEESHYTRMTLETAMSNPNFSLGIERLFLRRSTTHSRILHTLRSQGIDLIAQLVEIPEERLGRLKDLSLSDIQRLRSAVVDLQLTFGTLVIDKPEDPAKFREILDIAAGRAWKYEDVLNDPRFLFRVAAIGIRNRRSYIPLDGLTSRGMTYVAELVTRPPDDVKKALEYRAQPINLLANWLAERNLRLGITIIGRPEHPAEFRNDLDSAVHRLSRPAPIVRQPQKITFGD